MVSPEKRGHALKGRSTSVNFYEEETISHGMLAFYMVKNHTISALHIHQAIRVPIANHLTSGRRRR